MKLLAINLTLKPYKTDRTRLLQITRCVNLLQVSLKAETCRRTGLFKMIVRVIHSTLQGKPHVISF